jgi:transcription factor SFP1
MSVMSSCSQTQHDSFSTNSAYSNYSSVTSPVSSPREITDASGNQPGGSYGCVPTLLYNPSSITPANTPSTSRVASPVPTQGQTQATYNPFSTQETSPASSHLSRSFRYPTPSRNRAYRQTNTLNYRVTHGHYNFSPSKDSEAPQALVAEKEVANGDNNLGAQIVNGELHQLERETQRRPRPFACSIGDCQQQYKNMDGLRTSLPCL